MVDTAPYEAVSEREIRTGRALAAIAYLPGLALIGLLEAPKNRYIRFHARQGLVLFLAEVVVAIAIAMFDVTFGRVPVAGFFVAASIKLGTGLVFLAATVYGAMKGAAGELVNVPFVGDYAERLPV